MKKKGFTLIELLVVIAIIGILAAMILVALATARRKAADTRVKGDLTQMRSDAEIFYTDNSSSYAGFCAQDALADPAGANFKTIIADLNNKAADTDAPADGIGNWDCQDTNNAWAVTAALQGGGGMCTDSTGRTYGYQLTGDPVMQPIDAAIHCDTGGTQL